MDIKLNINKDEEEKFIKILGDFDIDLDQAIYSLIRFVNEKKNFPGQLIEYVDNDDSDPVESYRRDLISAGYTGFNLEQLVYQFEMAIKDNLEEDI